MFVSSRKTAMSTKQAPTATSQSIRYRGQRALGVNAGAIYRNAAMRWGGVGLIMNQRSIRRTSNCKPHIGVFVR